MHVMYNIAFTARDVAAKISTFLDADCLKNQVMAKILNQVTGKGFQLSNYLLQLSPSVGASPVVSIAPLLTLALPCRVLSPCSAVCYPHVVPCIIPM